MKLYTEEQVREMLENAGKYPRQIDFLLENLTPIELPSDEEIKEISREKSRLIYDDETNFQLGARYVINKLQGGNNENN